MIIEHHITDNCKSDDKSNYTVIIQIGNSDNKLLQAEWSKFVNELRSLVKKYGLIHFSGGSCSSDPWQNYCIVVEMCSGDDLKSRLSELAAKYYQDSIAITIGQTEFIKAK